MTARSPDLSSLDLFLWGHLISKMYATTNLTYLICILASKERTEMWSNNTTYSTKC